MSHEELYVVSSDACHCAAIWRGHLLVIWYGEVSAESASMIARRVIETARANPKRAAYIPILRDSVRLPSAAVRNIWIHLGRQLGDSLNSIAVIIEGKGFIASGTRAIVTGLGLTARAAFPLHTFATIEEAANWVRLRVQSAGGSFGTPFELAEAFAALEAAHKHPPLSVR
jgi:hypothetical protein